MACYLAVLVQLVATHYKWPALPQFSVKTAPDSILGQQILKLFLVHALRPPSKLSQHLAKPLLDIFKFYYYYNCRTSQVSINTI